MTRFDHWMRRRYCRRHGHMWDTPEARGGMLIDHCALCGRVFTRPLRWTNPTMERP